MTPPRPGLVRRLGVRDAVVVGLGAMIGAGVFGALAPAAAAAGPGLVLALGVAAVVAWCNATSSARLAAVHPESGGTYVYATRRLGDFWGHLAGWAFVVGKTASCAAMALVFASYVAPDHLRTVAAVTVVALTAVTYRGVQKSALLAVGPGALAASAAPLRDVVAAGSWAAWDPVVSVGAAAASLGALLSLVLGVSRTAFAMARDRHLPPVLAAVHPRFGVPHRAELAVGAAVVVLVLTVDLTGAIGFSSFGVLTYYAITNASALRLTRAERRPPRAVPVLGLVGCLGLAVSLPASSVLGGLLVLALGAASWAVRTRLRPPAPRRPPAGDVVSRAGAVRGGSGGRRPSAGRPRRAAGRWCRC